MSDECGYRDGQERSCIKCCLVDCPLMARLETAFERLRMWMHAGSAGTFHVTRQGWVLDRVDIEGGKAMWRVRRGGWHIADVREGRRGLGNDGRFAFASDSGPRHFLDAVKESLMQESEPPPQAPAIPVEPTEAVLVDAFGRMAAWIREANETGEHIARRGDWHHHVMAHSPVGPFEFINNTGNFAVYLRPEKTGVGIGVDNRIDFSVGSAARFLDTVDATLYPPITSATAASLHKAFGLAPETSAALGNKTASLHKAFGLVPTAPSPVKVETTVRRSVSIEVTQEEAEAIVLAAMRERHPAIKGFANLKCEIDCGPYEGSRFSCEVSGVEEQVS